AKEKLGEARWPRSVRLLRRGVQPDARAAGGRVEAARHAEVETGPGPLVELEPEVLSVTPDRTHPAADEGPPEPRRRHFLEHDRIVRADGLHDAAALRDLHGDEPAALDLGKLGHGAEDTSAAAEPAAYTPRSGRALAAATRSTRPSTAR